MRKIARKCMAAVLSVALAFGGISYTAKSTTQVQAAMSYDGWDLVWSDEFNGDSLDTSVWNYEIGNGNWGWGNGEWEYYTNRTENINVSGGSLHINALKENYGGQQYTSARINTKGKKSFKYGRIEARMKLPSFTGAWPAFWMLGSNFDSVGWPRCGEIDIMEAINTENFTNGALHWYVDSAEYQGQGDTGSSAEGKTPSGYNRTDWHTYGIEWDSERIRWYIDDKVFLTQGISDSQMDEFRKNQFIIFNLAVCGQWPGYTADESAFPARSSMEVDYVRVYQKNDEATTKYDGPMITVDQDAVAEYDGAWNPWWGTSWLNSSGNIELRDTTSEGFTANITSIGTGGNKDSVWSIQSKLENMDYYAGNTYTYKCTITSDKDKTIYVKVADEDENTLGGGLIELKAGTTYNFETTVEIPEDFEGTVSLKFGMGKVDGESMADNSAVTIDVKDVSFTTTATIPDPNYQPTTTEKPTTAEPTTEKLTTNNETTTVTNEQDTTVKLAKAKIKKVATKKLSAKKIKIKLKKTVAGADGYQVRVYKTKKNAKANKKAIAKKTIKKNKKTLKISKKKLANKKKLYVRVRAYKTVNGKKVTGKWSKTKKVKVK